MARGLHGGVQVRTSNWKEEGNVGTCGDVDMQGVGCHVLRLNNYGQFAVQACSSTNSLEP